MCYKDKELGIIQRWNQRWRGSRQERYLKRRRVYKRQDKRAFRREQRRTIRDILRKLKETR